MPDGFTPSHWKTTGFFYTSVVNGEDMPPSTPIAKSKTAALTRVTDSAPKGYTRYVSGQVSVDKAERVLKKFHDIHKIGATPAQRQTRKLHGKANALLVVYWPEAANTVEWLLMFTTGELEQPEQLQDITQNPRLVWLGYELVRRTAEKSKATRWTWRRPKQTMAEFYALIADQLKRKAYDSTKDTLDLLARHPGFHGVRAQTFELVGYAISNGYPVPPKDKPDPHNGAYKPPHLFFTPKVSHGEPFEL